VVLVPFPFSDLSQAKLRPAVALANAGRDDWILCQVTTSAYGDPHAIELTAAKLARSSLRSRSYVRPGKLFTASRSLMVAEIGMLQLQASRDVANAVISILRASVS
jgi:mRNA interferase MazF